MSPVLLPLLVPVLLLGSRRLMVSLFPLLLQAFLKTCYFLGALCILQNSAFLLRVGLAKTLRIRSLPSIELGQLSISEKPRRSEHALSV